MIQGKLGEHPEAGVCPPGNRETETECCAPLRHKLRSSAEISTHHCYARCICASLREESGEFFFLGGGGGPYDLIPLMIICCSFLPREKSVNSYDHTLSLVIPM